MGIDKSHASHTSRTSSNQILRSSNVLRSVMLKTRTTHRRRSGNMPWQLSGNVHGLEYPRLGGSLAGHRPRWGSTRNRRRWLLEDPLRICFERGAREWTTFQSYKSQGGSHISTQLAYSAQKGSTLASDDKTKLFEKVSDSFVIF